MLRLKPIQRAILAAKLPDLANLVMAAITIGFLLGEPRASAGLVVAGFAVWVGVVLVVLRISGEQP